MKWYLKALRQYVDFKGRARRSEYWYFILFQIILTFALAFFIDFISTSGLGFEGGFISDLPSTFFSLFILASIPPYLAVTVRRLHDSGKSGMWFFIYFVPIIGGIWLLILLLQGSQPGENKWGPNPKAIVDSGLSLDSGMITSNTQEI